MKITIPKPGIEQEVHEEEKEENCGQNGDTELGKENVDVAEAEDLPKPAGAGVVNGGKEAPNESLHANGDQNGVDHNEGDGDGKEERCDEEEEEGENREENAKPGAKSTTVIIARTHPGESNTSFIVQGAAVTYNVITTLKLD